MSSSELYMSGSRLKSVVGSTTRSSLGLWSSTHSSLDGELLIQNSPVSMEYRTDVLYFWGPSKLTRRIKGIDVGSTSEGNGSIWVSSSTNTLRYAYNGRQYDCYRSGIANRISGSTLYVYSDSGRTNLVATVGYTSSSVTYINVDGGTHYYTFEGSGSDSYNGSFTLYNGQIHTFTGTYTPSENATYVCECNYVGVVTSTNCLNRTYTCFDRSDGSCSTLSEGKVCKREDCVEVQDDPVQLCACKTYECETRQTGSSSPDSWSVSLSIS